MNEDRVHAMIEAIRARMLRGDDESSSEQEDGVMYEELQISEVARAVLTRHQYGCVLTAESCHDWLKSVPMHGNVKVTFDILPVQRAREGSTGDIDGGFAEWMHANPRLLLSQNNSVDRSCCMFALMPPPGADATNIDATDEILSMWMLKCDVKPKWTPQHICIHGTNIKILLLRKYITFDEAVRTLPSVYRVEGERIRMHMHESMLYQHMMDVWFIDGSMDTRSVVSSSKFALGCVRTVNKDMTARAKTQIEELAKKYKYVCMLKQKEDSQLIVKIEPVAKEEIIRRVKKAYPELQDIVVKYKWNNPHADEFNKVLQSCHMRNTGQYTWMHRARYKYKSSYSIVPFNPTELSPLTCLNPVGAYTHGSIVRKYGYSKIETCLRLIHLRLHVFIPRAVWNGIIRLALYYHAGTVLEKLLKLPPCDVTFEKIALQARLV